MLVKRTSKFHWCLDPPGDEGYDVDDDVDDGGDDDDGVKDDGNDDGSTLLAERPSQGEKWNRG